VVLNSVLMRVRPSATDLEAGLRVAEGNQQGNVPRQ
jgi:hypothetical protein